MISLSDSATDEELLQWAIRVAIILLQEYYNSTLEMRDLEASEIALDKIVRLQRML